MKVVMKSVYDDGKRPLNPGDIGEFDDAEGQRLIDVGGARLPTDEETAALLEEIAARDQKLADAAAAKAAAKAAK